MHDGRLNNVVLNLQNFHAILVNHKTHVGLRYGLQLFRDQAIKSFWAVGGQFPVEVFIDGPDCRTAVDNKSAIVLGNDVGAGF